MERRPRRPARQRRLHHGSYGQLLDDEDLLQQCLATLVMDAAILRQQQQLQQEQLKLQQVSDVLMYAPFWTRVPARVTQV